MRKTKKFLTSNTLPSHIFSSVSPVVMPEVGGYCCKVVRADISCDPALQECRWGKSSPSSLPMVTHQSFFGISEISFDLDFEDYEYQRVSYLIWTFGGPYGKNWMVRIAGKVFQSIALFILLFFKGHQPSIWSAFMGRVFSSSSPPLRSDKTLKMVDCSAMQTSDKLFTAW